MQTHPIHVAGGRQQVLEVRSELFAFSDVLDVFATGRPDVLVVVSSGRPRPAQWVAVLRAAGYEIPVRRHANPGGEVPTLGKPRSIESAGAFGASGSWRF